MRRWKCLLRYDKREARENARVQQRTTRIASSLTPFRRRFFVRSRKKESSLESRDDRLSRAGQD